MGKTPFLTAEPIRQQEWELVVRRSFGVPDLVSHKDAREALIRCVEDELRENGWQIPARATAEAIVDALMKLGTVGDPDDTLLSGATLDTREAAYRLIDKGLTLVDPEHLVFDVMSEYPTEVVAVAQNAMDRIFQYVREQPVGD
jgi:hypothetical protein